MNVLKEESSLNLTLVLPLIILVTILLNASEISGTAAQNLPSQNSSISESNSTLYVSGTATDRIEPDRVSISIGVETTNYTAKDALLANSYSMSKILSSLREVGIVENETGTSQFNIRPNYNYSESGTVLNITGFTVANSLEIQSSKLQNISSIIDASVAAGANSINNIGFFVSNEKLEKVKNSLIENAIANAREKADTASSAVGLQIVGIKSIVVDIPDYLPPPQPFYELSARSSDMAQESETPILSGEQEVSVKADIVFLIGR